MLIVCLGFFGLGMNKVNIASAENQTIDSSVSLDQLRQMVLSLQQQIAQLIKLIDQKKNNHVCGNGICETGSVF